jgi:hypothetical protein
MLPGFFFGSTGWNPNDEGQPLVWLDASQGIFQSSGKVNAWVCRSQGWLFTQASSVAQPGYSATGWNSNRPGVVFGGSGYTDLRCDSNVLGSAWNAFTIVATINITTASTRQFIVFEDNAVTSAFGWGINASNNELLDLHAGGADITGGAITGASKRLWLSRSRGSSSNASNVNGSSSISSSDATDTGSGTRLTIGGQSLIGISYLRATLVELIIWGSSKSSSVDTNYRAYSAAKWGG